MNKERLEEIREANKARTPGKWFWFGYFENKSFELEAFAPNTGGVKHVMGFRRWGMHGAQPTFSDPEAGLIIEAKEKLIVTDQGSCNPKIKGVNVPDSQFIAKAPEYVTELLELADQQVAEIGRLKAEIKELNTPFKPVKAVNYSMAVELEIEGVPV